MLTIITLTLPYAAVFNASCNKGVTRLRESANFLESSRDFGNFLELSRDFSEFSRILEKYARRA
eukprot:498862-Amorphochlora_amoeboformis.AAC.1